MAINFCDGAPDVVAGLTTFTPTIPKFYWDVDSQEQGIKQLCKTVQMLIDYLNEVAAQVNLDTDSIEELLKEFNEEIPKLDARVTALEKALETLTTSLLVYDPTKGKYTNSMCQSRRMLQILGNPSDENLTVKTIADSGRTVADLAQVMCGAFVNDAFKRMAGIDMPYQED